MKRKITIFLGILFSLFITGVTIVAVNMNSVTDELNFLIILHKAEDLRKDLIINILSVQRELYTFDGSSSELQQRLEEKAATIETEALKCTGCHHEADVENKLVAIQKEANEYVRSIISALKQDVSRNAISNAIRTGNVLTDRVEKMSFQAIQRINKRSTAVKKDIERAKLMLFASIALSLSAGIAIAFKMTRSIMGPLNRLLRAARATSKGNFIELHPYENRTELGELISTFNNMNHALKESYAKLHEEMEEHRKTTHNLIQSEHFLNIVFDSIHDPFIIYDRDYRIVKLNDAYARLKKISKAELLGSICFERIQGKSSVCDSCIIEETFQSGHSCVKERSFVTPHGIEAWSEVYTYPIMDDEGAISHVVEYSRDISERKRTENELRESRERYALAAEGANDGLWDWDLAMNSVYYSSRWKSMLGYEEREIGTSPKDWFNLVHGDDKKMLETLIDAHISGSIPHLEVEHRMMHKDESFRWVLTRGLAVRDEAGKAYRMSGSQTDITERKEAEEQLLHNAFHDSLTGLPNRALFSNRVEHMIKSAPRQLHCFFAVLLLDLDRFKIINDSLGHPVGDRLIIEVAERLVTCLRPGDTVARMGGDEFAILLESIKDIKDAVQIVERIQGVIPVPMVINGNEVITTVSIGIALSSVDYKNAGDILRDADIAMYHAKAKGKDQFEVFDPQMHANIIDRIQLEADLRRAIENNEFIIHYQPIIDLASNSVIGFEALIRWAHPTRGLIYPLQFIPIAEETGLINDVGKWVLKESCRQIKAWQEQYPTDPPLKVSLNVSGRQFAERDFSDRVGEVLQDTGLDPACLTIEITESMIMADSEFAIEMLENLRALGITIHVDDFGTGYSSLSYIHRFPVNALKIDRSFMAKMLDNKESLEIIKAIIALAGTLDLEVVAEGVELTEQLTQIRGLKCQYGQGFLFSKPRTPDVIDSWIRGENQLIDLV